MATTGKRKRRGNFSDEELQLIKGLYRLYTRRELAALLGARPESVRHAARRLQTRSDRRGRGPLWTAREDQRLRALYGRLRARELARELGRPVGSVYARARLLGVRKNREKSLAGIAGVGIIGQGGEEERASLA